MSEKQNIKNKLDVSGITGMSMMKDVLAGQASKKGEIRLSSNERIDEKNKEEDANAITTPG